MPGVTGVTGVAVTWPPDPEPKDGSRSNLSPKMLWDSPCHWPPAGVVGAKARH